jgi:Fe2+ transport system protein FeoA
MTLLDAPLQQKLKIIKLLDGLGLRKKLSILDVHFDDEIIKVKGARWGPIIIQKTSGNSKLALGRGIAEKIQVELVNKDQFNFDTDEI